MHNALSDWLETGLKCEKLGAYVNQGRDSDRCTEFDSEVRDRMVRGDSSSNLGTL